MKVTRTTMNPHLKLAYDYGVQQALEDAGLTKEAVVRGQLLREKTAGWTANQEKALERIMDSGKVPPEVDDFLPEKSRPQGADHLANQRALNEAAPGISPKQRRQLEYLLSKDQAHRAGRSAAHRTARFENPGRRLAFQDIFSYPFSREEQMYRDLVDSRELRESGKAWAAEAKKVLSRRIR